MASVLTAQVFFFSELSNKSLNDDRELLQTRLVLDGLINAAKNILKTRSPGSAPASDYKTFYDNTKIEEKTVNQFTRRIHRLNYNFLQRPLNSDSNEWKNVYMRIFASMPHDNRGQYYLIRARTTNATDTNLMYQVLVVRSRDQSVTTLSHSEIWY